MKDKTPAKPASADRKLKILFQLSGSIACYKACYLISKLVQEGHEIRIACSVNALKFVGAATLEGLCGSRIFTDAYEQGRMLDHIRLTQWADIAVLCPASANTINRIACGLADDVLGSLFLAWDISKPYLVAPAMNQEMFRNPATQGSIRKLREWGVRVLDSEVGRQACGDFGPGRLLDPDGIYEELLQAAEVGL